MYTHLPSGWLTTINLHTAARSICQRIAVNVSFNFYCRLYLSIHTHTHTHTHVMFESFEIIKPAENLQNSAVSHSTRRKVSETRRRIFANKSKPVPKFPYSRRQSYAGTEQIFNLASANGRTREHGGRGRVSRWKPIGTLMDRDLQAESARRGLSICAFTYQRVLFLPVRRDTAPGRELSLTAGNAADIGDEFATFYCPIQRCPLK